MAQPGLTEAISQAVAEHTAGSPVDAAIQWTNRSPREIAEEVAARGFEASQDTVRRILTEELDLRRRQAFKTEAARTFEFRDEQFQHIARLRRKYERRGWPVLSIDAKQKEPLGEFFRAGQAYTNGLVKVQDHDFVMAQQRLVPYGVYDVTRNEGLMLLTTGAETSQLVCDALWRWWRRLGHKYYWRAPQLLVLCDSGGANGRRRHRFKEDLYALAQRLHRPIRVAHYPPGCSKYNPIEHRMFCHVSRTLQAVILKSVHLARDFIARTTSSTGLRVIAEIARRTYAKGLQATQEFLNEMPLEFHRFLPELNYTVPEI